MVIKKELFSSSFYFFKTNTNHRVNRDRVPASKVQQLNESPEYSIPYIL